MKKESLMGVGEGVQTDREIEKGREEKAPGAFKSLTTEKGKTSSKESSMRPKRGQVKRKDGDSRF